MKTVTAEDVLKLLVRVAKQFIALAADLLKEK